MPASELGAFVAGTGYDDVPHEVLEYGKRIVLDTLACIVGGCAVRPRHDMLLGVGRALGGSPEATILVSGDRVGAATAAMVNAEAGGALSAQESLYFTHTANLVLSVALALAERRRADGRSLLVAFVLGYEVAARLGLFRSTGPRDDGATQRTFDASPSIGAAAAAASMLGLDAGRATQALAIAAATAPGDARSARLGALNYAGFHHKAYCGTVAALLAEQGFTGYPDLLPVAGDSGSRWWTLDACLKRHPTCRYLSGPLDRLERVLRDERLEADEIEHVVVHLAPVGIDNAHVATASLAPDPLDPAEPLNLVFNAPYQVAMVALGVRAGPAWFDPARFDDGRVLALMRRVSLERDSALGERMHSEAEAEPHGRARSSGGSGVTVCARGRSYASRGDAVAGDPWSVETHVTDEQLAEKLCTYGDSLLPRESLERVCKLVLELECVADVNELTRLLVAA